jgi:hypothetical protein
MRLHRRHDQCRGAVLDARRVHDGNVAPNPDGDLEGGVTMHVAGRRRPSVHRIARTDGEAWLSPVHLRVVRHRRHDDRIGRKYQLLQGHCKGAVRIGWRLRLVEQGGMVATNPSGLGGFLGGDPAADRRFVQGGAPPSD